MLSGNMYHTETDISIKGRGGLPIVFERSYNSQQPQDGPLGYGWTHSFNHYLKFYGVEGGVAKVSWTAGTGGEKFFSTASHSNGNVTVGAILGNPSGVYVVFQRAGDGTYTLREKNGLTYKFASATGPSGVPGSGTTPVVAQLLSITDRNGNVLNLSYSGASCPGGLYVCSVTDAIGRSLTLTYTGNRISQIQDFTGRKYQYGYTGSDLTTFKNPLAVANSQNPVSYSYYSATDGTVLAHLMKQYTLPRGNGMRFEYYPNGRTARHTVVLTDGSLSPDQVNTFRYNDFRRESIQTNEGGYDRHFFFDPFGNPLRVVEENGAEHVYTYDCTDPTQAIGSASCTNPYNRLTNTGPDGYQSQYQYDTKGNVIKVTPPRGSTAAVQYLDFTNFNQPRRIQDGNGHWTILRYDANGNLTDAIKTAASYTPPSCASSECAIPPAAQILAWTVNGYDTVTGNLTSSKRVRDFAGQIANNTPTSNTGPITSFSYDTNKLNATGVSRTGLQNSDTAPSSQSATLGYDSLGRLKTGIDADWQATQFNYDDLDRIIEATDRLGNLRSYGFDANGNPTGQKLELPVSGVLTLLDSSSIRYDDSDRKVASTDAGGFVTAYSYDPAGNVLSVTNPDAYSIGFDYDANSRPQRAYDQEDHAVSTNRDPSGRMRSVTDPNGHTVTRTYWDSSRDGRLKTTTQPKITSNGSGPVLTGGRSVQYDWDANGNAISVTEIPAPGSGQANRTATTSYDELNRPTRSVGPVYTDATYGAVCPVTINRYDSLGRLWQVAAGRTPSPCATPANDVTPVQVTYAYDDFDRLVNATDALGRYRTAHYDAHNNVDSATDAKSQTTSFTWGYGHQLMTRVEQGGRTTTYDRNLLGQPTSVTHPEASYAYDYDAAHRLKRLTDKRGNKTLTYDWSPGGWLNGVTDSDGRITSYRYDPVGRLSEITAPNGDTAAFRFDAGGRLMEKILPNGVSARYAWNEDDSLKQIVNRNTASAILTQHDYAYDGVGNRYSQTENIGGSTLGYAYGYDELKRLTQVTNGTAAQQENYAYDPLGNRTTKSVGATSPTVTAYKFDLANQITEIHSGSLAGPLLATLTYDNNGNLQSDGSRTYTWDAIDQLSQVSKSGTTVAYGYDGLGQRVRKVTGGVTTQWLYDGSNIYAEYGSSWTNPNAVYTFAGLDHPLMRTLATGSSSYGTSSYYAQDGLGSVVGTSNNTDSTTQTERFDAWGNKLSGTIPQAAQIGYTGREPDETGLIFYRARYYDPMLGRFVSRDPIGLAGGINRYAYVNGNPVNLVDPWGRAALPPDVLQTLNSNKSYTGEVMTDAPGGCGVGDVCAQIAPPVNPVTGFGFGVGVAGSKTGNQSLNSSDKSVESALQGGSDRSGGSGGGLDPCSAFGVGCNNSSSSDPGRWVDTNESMSPRAARYQEQVTGSPSNQSYKVNGVKFDGYSSTTNTLIDAKGPGYADLLGSQYAPVSNGVAKDLVGQALRQVNAASGSGATVEWRVAEENAATMMRQLLRENNISGIRITHIAPR
jgi:RHS repeat-associated protein